MRTIAVLDLETDPFEYGKVPQPFCGEYWDGTSGIVAWGDDCIAKLAEAIMKRPPSIIYAHNGGKFDFLYYLEWLHSDMRIVNGRIIQAWLGEHELRDSFAILPFPLREFNKDEIDYEKMRRDVREKNRDEILTYLHHDCTNLHELVTAFYDEFGDNLTVGGSSLKQLKKFHKFKSGGDLYDAKFRKPFYYGGRNQVFRAGIIEQPVAIYDINSQYPFSMSAFLHPVSIGHSVSNRIQDDTCFVVAEGKNDGAFPTRNERGGLDFTIESGVFSVSIHEWIAALETRSFRPSRIIKTYGFNERASFNEFIDHFYTERLDAKRRGDKIHALFYKYVLNSCYGKFAQNPENYSDWCIQNTERDPFPTPLCTKNCDANQRAECRDCWNIGHMHHGGRYTIWERPTPPKRQYYYNVAIGASITGAARSLLLRGIRAAVDPLYCDTDSIICRRLNPRAGIVIDDNQLGAWKIEATGDLIAIAGKKLYAVFKYGDPPPSNDKQPETLIYNGRKMHVVKKAHKGVRLSGRQLLNIANGGTEEYCNPVPSFQLDGKHVFTTRRIRMTV